MSGKGWRINTIEKTPFGEGIMKVLIWVFMSKKSPLKSDKNKFYNNPLTYGKLQPLLQEYFPKYQHKFTISDLKNKEVN